MKKTTTSRITSVLPYPVEQVWKTVTSPADYAWRSDLSRIAVVEEGKRFIEYTRNGYSTTFTVTSYEPLKRYAFDLENSRMTGSWTGTFSAGGYGGTTICFTEQIQPKSLFLKPLLPLFLWLQQRRYIRDLKKKLRQSQNELRR